MIEGLLLVDKPEGWTSFDVVAKTRGIIRAETGLKKPKIGHTGTLDPAATGLLVIAIGAYTKKVPELIKQDKTYEVTMYLGKTSSTGDKEGEITEISNLEPNVDVINKVLSKFTGELMQTPPVFSAIKVNGRRAYDLARKGGEVKIEPRQVTIYSNTLQNYKYPYVKFESKVASGTYIRSLVEDIGKELGTGAYMSDLVRTEVGSFNISKALKINELSYSKITNSLLIL